MVRYYSNLILNWTCRPDYGLSTQVAIRAKLERQKQERQRAKIIATGGETEKQRSALDRFRRPG